MAKDRENNIYKMKSKKERFAPFPHCEFERDELGYPISPEIEYQSDYYDIELAEKEAWKPNRKIISSSDIEKQQAIQAETTKMPKNQDLENIPF